MRRASLFAVAALGLFHGAPASACTITVTPVVFGTYTPASGAPLDGTGSVRVDCRHNDTPSVSFGAGSSGSLTNRRMANGTSYLQYNLYSTAARVSILGSGTGGTVTIVPPIIQSVGLRRIRESAVYGRIPAGQNVRAGTYTDTLFVTVNF